MLTTVGMKGNRIIDNRGNRYFFILFFLTYTLNVTAQNESDIFCEEEQRIEEVKIDTLQIASPLTVQLFDIKSIPSDSLYKATIKLRPSQPNIYDMPYSTKANYPNYKRLALNTGVLYGAGFVALGVLQLLPEDATSWNKKEITSVPFFQRWRNNVKNGPVWDKDDYFFNYVLHPYGGAAYYMAARSQGLNIFNSFLYSAGISTFFWEYGIEAFMEKPSIQDLIVTPTAGTLIGEGFYLLKRHIVANDYELFGSSFLGNVVAYIIDPVNEVVGIFAGNPNRKRRSATDTSLACTPWFNGNGTGFSINLSF